MVAFILCFLSSYFFGFLWFYSSSLGALQQVDDPGLAG
jgi:hypothetical protein